MEAKENEKIEADVVVEEGKFKGFLKRNSKKILVGFGGVVAVILGIVAAMILSGGDSESDAVSEALDDVGVDFKEVNIDGDTIEVGTF